MTNRERLTQIVEELESVKREEAISPTPYSHLDHAAQEIRRAMQFVLSIEERDHIG